MLVCLSVHLLQQEASVYCVPSNSIEELSDSLLEFAGFCLIRPGRRVCCTPEFTVGSASLLFGRAGVCSASGLSTAVLLGMHLLPGHTFGGSGR